MWNVFIGTLDENVALLMYKQLDYSYEVDLWVNGFTNKIYTSIDSINFVLEKFNFIEFNFSFPTGE